MVKIIAKAFIARVEATGMKGAARDRAALEYFLGAYAALVATDPEGSEKVAVAASLFVAVGGYAGVLSIAKD